MRPIHALAVLGALAATPALAQQEYPSPQGGAQQQAVQQDFLAQLQHQLQQGGYYQGPVDGVFGAQTRDALAQWQRDKGLQPTGQLNAQTLAAMDVGSMSTQQAETPREGTVTRTPRESTTTTTTEQQAQQPGETSRSDLETLREEHMSGPNVENEPVPERPGTGTPAPGARPEGLETPPRD